MNSCKSIGDFLSSVHTTSDNPDGVYTYLQVLDFFLKLFCILNEKITE